MTEASLPVVDEATNSEVPETPASSQPAAAPKASFSHRSSGGLSIADSLGMSASSQLGATPKARVEAAASEADSPVVGQEVGEAQWGRAITRKAACALRNIVSGLSDDELWQPFQDAGAANPSTEAASSDSHPKGSSAPASSGPSEVKIEQVKDEFAPASGGSPNKVRRTTGRLLLADVVERVKKAAAGTSVTPSVATGDGGADMETDWQQEIDGVVTMRRMLRPFVLPGDCLFALQWSVRIETFFQFLL